MLGNYNKLPQKLLLKTPRMEGVVQRLHLQFFYLSCKPGVGNVRLFSSSKVALWIWKNLELNLHLIII